LYLHALTARPWSLEEAQALPSLAQGAPVVVDSYLFDESYLDVLNSAAKLAVIDDMGRLARYPCALAVNPNLHAEVSLYEGKLRDDATLLIGTPFAMLRAEFAAAAAKPRTIASSARKILATFGGVDPKGASAKCLEAFALLGDAFEAELIIGAANPQADDLVRRAPPGVKITRAARDLGARFAEAEIVLSASGTTVWEAACVGAPLMLVAAAPEEVVSAKRVADLGMAIFLGEIETLTPASIAAAIRDFAGDLALRARSHVLGKEIVDGRGAAHVAEAIAAL
jgi:spore coat polysaccharide biosynthesis predicted glycosyltransferase SpsG